MMDDLYRYGRVYVILLMRADPLWGQGERGVGPWKSRRFYSETNSSLLTGACLICIYLRMCCSGGCWRSTMTRTIPSPSCCLISAPKAAGPSSPSFCSNIWKHRQDSCKHLVFLCGLRGVLRLPDDINKLSVSIFVGEAQWRRCMFIKPQNFCSCCPLLSFVHFSSYMSKLAFGTIFRIIWNNF